MAEAAGDKISKTVDDCRFELVRGDITKQGTEAVVNAANKKLAPGGGVAGAIHQAAGRELWEECKELDGCETGKAKITKGYSLPASYVIHTVGPVYSNSPEDKKLLEASYRNSLKLARDKGLESVSFPALSTGAFGYPEREAGKIALETILGFLQDNSQPKLIRLVLYGKSSFDLHKNLMSDIFENSL